MGLYLRTSLRPSPWPVPFLSILERWMAAELDPDRCRLAIEDALAGGMPDGLLDPSAIARGDIVATPAVLFGSRVAEPWIWLLATPSGPRGFVVPPSAIATVAEVIRLAVRAETIDEACADATALIDDEDILAAFRAALFDPRSRSAWRPIERPGIYRREHASLVVRGTGRDIVVIDPQRSGFGWTTNDGDYPGGGDLEDPQVIVTHAHDDHWEPASIVSCGTTRPVWLPPIPAPSLLCDDLGAELALLDEAACAPAWWQAIELDGMRVDVLPFYGEQPARHIAPPAPVRNWGSCHRFELDGWSAALLVDTGADADGSMVEVIERSVAERGPIDVVLSACGTFPEMLNTGVPHYAFTLPFEAMRARRASPASMTSGPEGIAEICRIAQARYFAPYAHGFRGLGQPTTSEPAEMVGLREELERTGTQTRVIEWRPGDSFHWRDGDLLHVQD